MITKTETYRKNAPFPNIMLEFVIIELESSILHQNWIQFSPNLRCYSFIHHKLVVSYDILQINFQWLHQCVYHLKNFAIEQIRLNFNIKSNFPGWIVKSFASLYFGYSNNSNWQIDSHKSIDRWIIRVFHYSKSYPMSRFIFSNIQWNINIYGDKQMDGWSVFGQVILGKTIFMSQKALFFFIWLHEYLASN